MGSPRDVRGHELSLPTSYPCPRYDHKMSNSRARLPGGSRCQTHRGPIYPYILDSRWFHSRGSTLTARTSPPCSYHHSQGWIEIYCARRNPPRFTARAMITTSTVEGCYLASRTRHQRAGCPVYNRILVERGCSSMCNLSPFSASF